MRTITKLAGVAALAMAAGMPQASAAGPTCSIQANHNVSGSSVGYTAAVNCTPSSTAIFGCVATAVVVHDGTGARFGPVQTAQGACGNSYSTVAASFTPVLAGTHHIEATYYFVILGDPASLGAGGDTASFNCPVQQQLYICTASSTSF